MRRVAVLGLSLLPLLGALAASAPEPSDPIARLRAEIAAGRPLAFEPKHGYLRDLLARLKVDPSSQTLVFSKTSLQSDSITRETPRAIYSNDEVYVGWIPKAPLIEIATLRPGGGVAFYTLENRAQGGFERDPKTCDRCHGGRSPRLFARSVLTAPSGYPRAFEREYDATPSLPIAKRWGGWYVTGTHGAMRHLGNELSEGTDELNRLDVEKGANVVDLRRYLDPRPYLTPHSDLVALMVMESQMAVQNAFAGGDPETIVEALLGVGEAPLSAPVAGTSGFAERYAASAPTDAQGRSLSQLDLRTRLLRYPCSPLVYSAPFDALPGATREAVWERLAAALKVGGGRFGHLSAEDRRATFEILRDTRPEFARVAGA